jgi:malate dehydrogenase
VRPIQLPKVAILGAGGLGSTLAGLIASAGAAANVVIIDLIPGLAQSIAVDLEHAGSLVGTETRVVGASDYASLAGADVVVVAPEAAASPDLVAVMLGEVQMAGEAIAAHAPQAVAVFGGWPSEVFTAELQRTTNFAPERVLGTGATLASARLVSAVSAVANARRAEVEAIAMGADGHYIGVLSSARVRGRPLREVLSKADVEAALAAAADAPSHVRSLRASRPPAFAPAHAVLEVLEALRGARPGPIPISVLVEGCYSIDNVVVGVTATLTPNGLQSVVELPLAPDELTAIQAAADSVRQQAEELLRH